MFATSVLFVLSQTCETLKSAYSDTCCPVGGLPTDIVPTSNLFVSPRQRFVDDILTRNVSVPVSTTQPQMIADAIYEMTLMEPRPADVSELTKSIGETITEIYYDSIDARGMSREIMINNTNLVSKAYVVIGGSFAVETAMALVRAGAGRVYIGSRTAIKQDMIKSGIVCDSQRDSTTLFHSCISSTDAAKIKWHTTIGNMDVRSMASITNFMSTVLADASSAGLELSGIAIAHGEGRTQPSLDDPTSTVMPSTTEDMANAPTFFDKTNSNMSPHPYIAYTIGYQNVVKVVTAIKPGIPIALVGSSANYFQPIGIEEMNPTVSAFDAIASIEYHSAKKSTLMTQKMAIALGSPTSIVHPVACHTGFTKQIDPLTTWYPLYTGVTGPWSATRTTALTYNELSIEQARANALAWAQSPGGQAIIGATGATPEQYVLLLMLADAPAVNASRFTTWPVPSKILNDKWITNDWISGVAFLMFAKTQLSFEGTWNSESNPTHAFMEYLIEVCVSQFDTEPFCTLTEQQAAVGYQIAAALYSGLSPGLVTPIASPVVVGARMAWNLITKSTDTFIQAGITEISKNDMPFGPQHYLDKRNHQSLVNYFVDLMSNRVGDNLRLVGNMKLV